jgi:hypothetical protein
MSETGPKAVGCLVNGDDIPRICASFCLFGAKLGIGACSSITAIAFSALPDIFDFSPTYLSYLLTFVGLGYVCGILICIKVLSYTDIPLSKTMLACICVHITAAAVVLSTQANELYSMCTLFFIEFMGVGAVDSFATLALSEMWGQRIQPWMQCKSAMFAIGATIPALLMRNHDLNWTCLFAGGLCTSSLLGLIADRIYWVFVRRKSERSSTRISETQQLFASPGRGGAVLPTHTRISIPTIMEEDYTSSELVLLDHAFATLKPNTAPGKISEMVINILDATEYCKVKEEQRNDPFFEPGIIKTLAFATPDIVKCMASLPPSDFDDPIALPPKTVMMLLCIFVAAGASLQCTYNNWIPLYSTALGRSHEEQIEATGHISAVFHALGALGCLLSVPLSIFFSTTALLRIHVGAVSFAIVALMLCQSESFGLLSTATALMGYGVMAIMPISLSVLNDYGYSM